MTSNLQGIEPPIKANVAIASAITAYARIHMMLLKLSKSVVYTDTDSIFTTEKLEDAAEEEGIVSAESSNHKPASHDDEESQSESADANVECVNCRQTSNDKDQNVLC